MIVKPLQLGILTRAYFERPRSLYFVAATGYFDLANPTDFEPDTAMWPAVAGILGEKPLDVVMPKPSAELLVAGEAAAPAGTSATQQIVEVAVGDIRKRLVVFGNRYWQWNADGPVFTRPEPFERMPITWDRAYGGQGHPGNPVGRGHAVAADVRAGQVAFLPNIEDPARLITSIDDAPAPVGLGPIDVMHPERQRLAGTHDETWLRKRHPGHAFDFDWNYYHEAPRDQWRPDFFRGDEAIRIVGMNADHPTITSRLPGMRVRAFFNVETEGGTALSEVSTRLDTVWLFPSIMKGVCIFRGGREVADMDGLDVKDVMLAYERLEDPPKSAEHYAEAHRYRTDPETMGFAVFSTAALRPDIPEAEQIEREAAREAYADEILAKSQKQHDHLLSEALATAGAPPLPAGSFPKLPPPPVKIPFPTPADIQRLDVDMGGFMKSMQGLQAHANTEITKMLQTVEAEATKALGKAAASTGKPVDLGVLKKIAALKPPAMPGLPGMPAPAAVGGSAEEADTEVDAEAATPPTMAELKATVEEKSGEEAYAALLDALGEDNDAALAEPSPVEIEEQKALVEAKALGLPEGRMLHPAIENLKAVDVDGMIGTSSEDGPDIADILDGSVPPPPAPDGEVDDFEAMLARLAEQDQEAADKLKKSMDDAKEASPMIGALLDMPKDTAAKPVKVSIEEAIAEMEARAPEADEGIATARRISIEPTAPMDPYHAEVSVHLGAIIRREVAAGRSLAGRDLAGADLREADLSGADLAGALLERADLRDARLTGAKLANATLAGALLAGADLSGADLNGANLSKVEGRGVTLADTQLSKAVLFEPDLREADLSRCHIEAMVVMKGDFAGAKFDGATIERTIFMQPDMTGVSLDGAAVERLVFMDVDLTGMTARGARLTKGGLMACRAEGSDFTGADLSDFGMIGGTKLDGSVFRDMVGVKSGWHGASLVGADFHAARLDGAEFGEADLTEARLTRASLKKAMMNGAVMDRVDATAASFFMAVLRRCALTGACLRKANLYGASLDEATLTFCDLTGANLNKTIFARAGDVS